MLCLLNERLNTTNTFISGLKRNLTVFNKGGSQTNYVNAHLVANFRGTNK